jgi:16S rRNA (cytosine967-C5)-methyltransferase
METTGSFPESLLARRPEDERDRRLTFELVHGVLRWRGRLDHVLAAFSKVPLAKLDPTVLDILRLGAYQMLFLTRVPTRAAVDESVKLAARFPRHIKGFVNAVLRAVADRGREVAFPDPQADPLGYLASYHSHPAWLVERYVARFGFEETERLLEANNAHPPLTARTNTLKISREELTVRLEAEGVTAHPTRYSPEGLTLEGAGDPARLTSLQEGLFQLQDEAAQLVAHLLAPQPGQRVLDACAGRGGKTLHLAALTAGQGEVLALDIDQRKLEVLGETARLLGAGNVTTLVHDATTPLGQGEFDRVLLDAPCTGTGVIRRRVDLKWRKKAGDVGRLAALQARMLEAASGAVAKGGAIVYAACSLEPEEGERLVEAFLAGHPGFALEDAVNVLGGMLPGPGPYLRTFPHRLSGAMDGFFAARLKRT